MTPCAEKDFTSGLMVDYTMDHIKAARKTEKGCIYGRMVKYMMVNLRQTTAMVLESCITQTASALKATGKTARKMVRELTFGLMALSTS